MTWYSQLYNWGWLIEACMGDWTSTVFTKDGKYAFLNIDTYKKGKGLNNTCDTNTDYKIKYINITSQFTGGKEAFINQWSEIIQELRYLGQ